MSGVSYRISWGWIYWPASCASPYPVHDANSQATTLRPTLSLTVFISLHSSAAILPVRTTTSESGAGSSAGAIAWTVAQLPRLSASVGCPMMMGRIECKNLPVPSGHRLPRDRVPARRPPRFHYLQEDSSQSAGQWNTAGELTHYFCDTPDSTWAEFLRHEEITDLEDLLTIRRALWVIEIGNPHPSNPISLKI